MFVFVKHFYSPDNAIATIRVKAITVFDLAPGSTLLWYRVGHHRVTFNQTQRGKIEIFSRQRRAAFGQFKFAMVLPAVLLQVQPQGF